MVVQILSKAVVEAQQALSEKFGIATFNLQGNVSTLPKTRPLDQNINIGVGSFGGTSQALNAFLAKFTPSVSSVPLVTVSSPTSGITQQPSNSVFLPQEVVLPNPPPGPSIFSQIQPYSGFIVLGVVSLIALALLKRA